MENKKYLYHYVLVVEGEKTTYADFFKAETKEKAEEFMDYLIENLMIEDTEGESRKANISDAWYERVETVNWKGENYSVELNKIE